MADRKVYKYMSLQHFDRFLDIIMYNRFYLANWRDFNDINEGVFNLDIRNETEYKRNLVEKIKQEKNQTRICSLSITPENPALWAYYADNYKGVVIEAIIGEDKLSKVDYTSDLSFRLDDTAKSILSRKRLEWQGEQEYRIIDSSGAKYIENVKITGIFMGMKNKCSVEAFVKIVRALNSSIDVIGPYRKNRFR